MIAGNGPDEDKIKEMINDLKLENRVKLIGPAYAEKKFQLLSEALFVALSSRHEGFCIFALEALASGLPLVAFDIPGIFWADCKAVVKSRPFSIDRYANNLVKTASKLNILDQKRKQAQQFARQFTWDSTADQYEDFFYQVLASENK